MNYLLHVAKCRKAHYLTVGTKIQLMKCPYNGRHFIPELEKHVHEFLCPDKKHHEYIVKLMNNDPICLKVGKEAREKEYYEKDRRNRFDEEYDDVRDSHV
ncbi:hypothetical protein L596_018849 [Steinernema carpocapsae]|uniref:CHHC U11-48K-type domain-containing protein n=1 Tax=Steinernema carpocapsae TaxID=34508 RepID=A0A4U5N5V8_STECR|nr:hypothetical protein L596_018849 [Steinernema carpocapsae]